MRSSSSSRKSAKKGQFFILTSVAVVTILFFVSRWIGPLTELDTSSIVLSEELFTFDNIKEKAGDVVKNSESCEELDYNIQEYKNFIENFAREKNYRITFDSSISPCSEVSSSVVEFTLRVFSSKVDARGNFFFTWP